MRVAGIIAEYNPLHNGHLRLIEKIRDDLGGQTPVLVIMSGEFVQRGIPAITDRTARVCALLSCGADVVLELPFTFATGSADRFAKGGILSLIGSGVVTDLYFGAEHASLEDLSYIAGLDPESDPAFLSTLESLQKDGQPYAAAWEQALLDHIRLQKNCDRSFLDSLSVLLHQPNNILAISYLRELKRAGSAIEPHVLLREVNKYARYWAATDCYQKARSADASLADDASASISAVARYYPEAAEAFMYDLTKGQSYTVSCGGMVATTTVRVQ